MVQQLSKAGSKDAPLLKAGHRPAGKQLFLHPDFYFYAFTFMTCSKSGVIVGVVWQRSAPDWDPCALSRRASFTSRRCLCTLCAFNTQFAVESTCLWTIGASVGLSSCSRDFTAVLLSPLSGPRCAPTFSISRFCAQRIKNIRFSGWTTDDSFFTRLHMSISIAWTPLFNMAISMLCVQLT